MKRRLITVILFAVIAAALSSTVLYKVISANSRGTVKAATALVLVAARDLNAGDLIGESDVREAEWPVTGGSPWIERRQDLVGRGVLVAISKDEPFAESRLAAKGAGAGLASIIPPGMRVVAVHIDELTGLSRFIFPGMRVDVISTGVAGAGAAASRTILQNIEVFSNGQNRERDTKDKPVAVQAFNLLVTPQQAEVLSQAVAQTRIELVLRNPLDHSSFVAAPAPVLHVPSDATPPRVTRTVSRTPEKSVLPPPPPSPPTVEIIHGSKKTVTTVGPADQESK